MLPGPIERVWAYLTESDLRSKWLASGDMELKVGAPFELVWRNSELTDPPGKRPEGFGEEHRMESRILEIDPPRKLVFTWGKEDSDVSMALEPRGEKVLLTVVHRRLPTRGMMVGVSTGWHAHLDMLVVRLNGEAPDPSGIASAASGPTTNSASRADSMAAVIARDHRASRDARLRRAMATKQSGDHRAHPSSSGSPRLPPGPKARGSGSR